jgi:hypothetical protein
MEKKKKTIKKTKHDDRFPLKIRDQRGLQCPKTLSSPNVSPTLKGLSKGSVFLTYILSFKILPTLFHLHLFQFTHFGRLHSFSSTTMRATLVSLLLAAAPALVSAKGTLGFSLGDKNADGTCKSTSDYEADFDALKGLSTLVRTYSGTECDTPQNILPAAKNKGFKVVLGMW